MFQGFNGHIHRSSLAVVAPASGGPMEAMVTSSRNRHAPGDSDPNPLNKVITSDRTPESDQRRPLLDTNIEAGR